ncbi:hypothetical protein FOMPIDRAFT_1056308 [Fomitopsis schrenkii]|uniref:Uncharacterized protein n=1 Tax=Fomitopsis schrenkii TaxID=2126942 RepID=S8DHM3_FOMSC|nr:hypothetical protein FOMPIDRAFT_1056308 [Fomitopsis schrenkii]
MVHGVSQQAPPQGHRIARTSTAAVRFLLPCPPFTPGLIKTDLALCVTTWGKIAWNKGRAGQANGYRAHLHAGLASSSRKSPVPLHKQRRICQTPAATASSSYAGERGASLELLPSQCCLRCSPSRAWWRRSGPPFVAHRHRACRVAIPQVPLRLKSLYRSPSVAFPKSKQDLLASAAAGTF